MSSLMSFQIWWNTLINLWKVSGFWCYVSYVGLCGLERVGLFDHVEIESFLQGHL